MSKPGILLINLGSPASPAVSDVRSYLREFLGDERVLDLPLPVRWALLEGIILRTRPKQSAHAYASIWTAEGSPLLKTSASVQAKLQHELGEEVTVYLAMRYGQPSIAETVGRIAAEGITDLLLIPQYAHYAMSSWETVVVKAEEELARQAPAVRLQTVQPFYADADYIEALHAVTAPYYTGPDKHLLFSYHGLPQRHLRKADSSHAHCLKTRDCCSRCSPAHATCYRAQVFATTAALAKKLGAPSGSYSVSFQSRLAGEPWLEPFTDRELIRVAQEGVRHLLVICPAFVAYCLETLEEIAVAGRETFLAAGGTTFTVVPCLNDQDPYIQFLTARAQGWLTSALPSWERSPHYV